MSKNIGKVVQIIGPVVDISFDEDHLPDLLTAIEIKRPRRGKLDRGSSTGNRCGSSSLYCDGKH